MLAAPARRPNHVDKKMKLLFGMLICLLVTIRPAAADDMLKPDEGILIIDVAVKFSSQQDGQSHAAGVWLKNIKTGKSYGKRADSLLLLTLPEGIYCVDEVTLWPRGMGEVSYCGEPYINVVRGRFNNAGNWRFVVDLTSGGIKLLGSVEHPEQTLEAIKKKYPEYF